MSKGHFSDPDFPPNEKAIGKIKLGEIVKDIQWLRPRQFIENPKLFADGKTLYPLVQGHLGNSHMIGSLTALAEHPKRLFNLITRVGNGKYEVKTYYKGTHQTVIIDDFIPCINKKPAFTSSSGNEYWALLIEKAYAKLAGSYAAIESGSVMATLSNITGMPVRLMKTDEFKSVNLFTKLKKYLEKSFTITAYNDEANQERVSQLQEKLGILSHRAYVVLGAYSSGEKKFIMLKSPMAEIMWKGKWNNEDPEWNRKLQEDVHMKKDREGVFYIELADFVKIFKMINVVIYKEELKCYKSFQITVNKKQMAIPLSSTGECMISVIQPEYGKELGLRMWCIDEHDQPIGGGSGRDFSLSGNIRGGKLKFDSGVNARVVIEVYGEDVQKLPGKLQVTIRSTDPVTVGKPANVHPDDYVGYGTPKDAAKAGKCVACGYPLTLDGIIESEKLGHYHDKCFRCVTCKCKIDEDYYIIDGKPYCESCSDLLQ